MTAASTANQPPPGRLANSLATARSGAIRRPRLGFLGVGWIGRHRLEAIQRSGKASIVAIADPNEGAAAQAIQDIPGAGVVSSFAELLRLDLDGVVIATPSALHAEQATVALSRGLAVFCQKPLGRNAAETAAVLRAARDVNRLLGVDLSYRHLSGVRRIKDLVGSNALGSIYAVDLVFHNAYGPDKAWFYDRALSGGGCVVDLGIHLVDLALWLLGFPKVVNVTSRLFGQGKPISGRSPAVEDYAEARIDLATGGTVRLACSWKISVGRDAVISGAFYGTNGGAAFYNVNGSFYEFAAERYQGTAREVLASGPEEWGGRAAIAWVEQLAKGPGFDSEAENHIQTAQVLDRIYESAMVGAAPPVPPSLERAPARRITRAVVGCPGEVAAPRAREGKV